MNAHTIVPSRASHSCSIVSSRTPRETIDLQMTQPASGSICQPYSPSLPTSSVLKSRCPKIGHSSWFCRSRGKSAVAKFHATATLMIAPATRNMLSLNNTCLMKSTERSWFDLLAALGTDDAHPDRIRAPWTQPALDAAAASDDSDHRERKPR